MAQVSKTNHGELSLESLKELLAAYFVELELICSLGLFQIYFVVSIRLDRILAKLNSLLRNLEVLYCLELLAYQIMISILAFIN